ncbi:unnamed protein product [Adineta steineri]|uniref:Uncharacterized protein n=1 Tax=Adineta steineri TaxID=433720 RepID=A0A814K6A0_9BILA|nr:unnamed protein product [Adineta steineri]
MEHDDYSNNNHQQIFPTIQHHDFKISSPQHVETIYSDPIQSISSSEVSTDLLRHQSSQDLEHLLYYNSPSPILQLPMLSSSANYTPLSSQNSQPEQQQQQHHHQSLFHSQSSIDYYPLHSHTRSSSLPVFTCSSQSSLSPHISLLSTDTNLFANDDTYLVKYHENIIVSPTNISNTSSPSKYRVLNTPERPHLICLTPSPKRDCFNEYLPFSEPIISENYPSICFNKYDISKNLQETLGYNPTYTEVLLGQTRDQHYAADAEREKYQADLDQQNADQAYSEIEKLVEKLQKDYRRAINKSQPYYEKKADYNKELDFQKRKVYGLEICVNEAKTQYQESLRNLEKISNEIHAQRSQGKLRRELGERTAGVGEEQITYTEFNPLPPSLVKTSPIASPKISSIKRINRPEQLLRSCLLRTEALPAGIFANTSGRSSPEGDETTPTNFNDQFLLTSKQPPPSMVIIDSDKQSKTNLYNTHERKSSDGYSSQLTDDEDERTGSLHVLTDEQLEHLTSVYHPLPPPPPSSSQTGTTKTSSTQISESLLYSLSNPLSKLVLR